MESNTNFTTEADSRNDRILNAFTGAYEEQWHIFVQEGPQNVADAQGMHIANGVIPETRTVTTEITVNTETNRVTVEDNVGGMKPDLITDVVTTIAETDSVKEAKESGGSFGLGLWMMAAKTNENGGLYIETAHEETNEAIATVLFPTGEHYTDSDGTPYDSPETVRERCGISIDRDTPEDWDEGGTLFVAENVENEVMNNLSDWEKVEERLQYKFPTLTGPENFDLNWVVDGETFVYDSPCMSELVKEEVENYTNLEITKGPEDAVVDELRFFRTTKETPWDNIPLMKTQPHTGRPYLVVTDYKVQRAGVITSSDGAIAGYARVDTVCDQHEWEDPAHEDVQFDPSDHTEISDIARDIQEEIVRRDIHKHSIDQPDATEVADSALGEARKVMADLSDGNLSLFGLEPADATVTFRPLDCDNLGVECEINLPNDGNVPETTFTITADARDQSTDEVVRSQTTTATVEPGVPYVEEIVFDSVEEGTYFVSGELSEDSVESVIDTTGTIAGAGCNIQPSASGGGGTGNAENLGETAASPVEDLSTDFRIVATEMHADEEDMFSFVTKGEEGWILHIDLLDPRWVNAAMSSENVRERKQKELVAREAVDAVVDRLKNDNTSDESYYMFRRFAGRIDDVVKQVNIE